MSTPSTRPVTRQKEAGEASRAETSRRLLQAASQLFAERGYAGSTVSAIAERAEVSLQTLYLAWGSKRALLRAYLEEAMTGSSTAVTEGRWVGQARSMVDDAASGGTDPQNVLRGVAHTFRTVAERAALAWKLYRDAAAVDPEIAADHAVLEQLRRKTLTGALSGVQDTQLRPGMTRSAAIDTVMVVASPPSHELLVATGQLTLDEYEEWIARTLISALLPDRPNAG